MVVYIDDIVVKSETQAEHTQHLEEAFCLMRAYNMKLNPTKCAFGVNARKFLTFMVTQRGIEVNPAQVKVVLETPTPKKQERVITLRGLSCSCGTFDNLFHKQARLFFLTLRGASMFNSLT